MRGIFRDPETVTHCLGSCAARVRVLRQNVANNTCISVYTYIRIIYIYICIYIYIYDFLFRCAWLA